MPSLSKNWQVSPPISPDADLALRDFPPIVRQILYNRGYSTRQAAKAYLAALPPPGTDPFNMIGIPEAVLRLEQALRLRERIAIYGDYDADGVTATALLVQVLRGLEADVLDYIPNRFDEGYGLNIEALDYLQRQGVNLIITVDCGIRSLIEAEYAKSLGLDLIISDHHHPGKDLPHALAVINPKQPADTYPDKDLAGVGLAYKLACALLSHLVENNYPNAYKVIPDDLLDLVALGTVADLAPLIGENRTLVRAGLNAIQAPRRQGIYALIQITGLKADRITGGDIGYVLGPRLNAAGRLESAIGALHLLTTQDVNEAGNLAQKLNQRNEERQKITLEIQRRAEQIALEENPDALLLFAAHPDFNKGVVGLAASRLTDLYYRPAIVAHLGEEFTRGSCRSIPEFHITEALDQCADLLERHGGHAAAAGFTIRNENLHSFKQRIQSFAVEQLSNKDLRPVLTADVDVRLSEMKPELHQYLDLLQPTGYGNTPAVFVSKGLRVKDFRTVGKDNAHLKLKVTDDWITHDAIAFNFGYWQENMPRFIDLMFQFERNEFNGREMDQLRVRDLKPARSQE